MPRTTISRTTITPIGSGGYNLTDSADFSTLTPGADNGVEFPYSTNDEVVLRNSTAGAAVFTFIIAQRAAEDAAVGGTITDTTVTVAAGKDYTLAGLSELFRDDDGNVAIDCDVAGKVLVLAR